jgi:signal peptidase I
MHMCRLLRGRGLVPENRRVYIIGCLVFWSVLSYALISRFVVSSAAVVGTSMTPTLEHGDWCVLNKLAYLWRAPQRGEIVAVWVPGFDDVSVKRVVALPQETVMFRDNAVYVNHHRLGEPYLETGVKTSAGPLTGHSFRVLPECYFVLGDNRERSLDSRTFGAVRREWIIARIVLPHG